MYGWPKKCLVEPSRDDLPVSLTIAWWKIKALSLSEVNAMNLSLTRVLSQESIKRAESEFSLSNLAIVLEGGE